MNLVGKLFSLEGAEVRFCYRAPDRASVSCSRALEQSGRLEPGSSGWKIVICYHLLVQIHGPAEKMCVGKVNEQPLSKALNPHLLLLVDNSDISTFIVPLRPSYRRHHAEVHLPARQCSLLQQKIQDILHEPHSPPGWWVASKPSKEPAC